MRTVALAQAYNQEELKLKDGLIRARVVNQNRGSYIIRTDQGDMPAEISGRLLHESSNHSDFPAVGDWVGIHELPGERRAVIHSVLPRHSSFSRKEAGPQTQEQIVAANIDTVFVVCALSERPNLRRAERYLTLAWQSGAIPVLLLTKSDLCDEVQEAIAEFASISRGCSIHAVSAITGAGFEELSAYLTTNQTVALVGPSGVGKSTIVNRLVGQDIQFVKEIREDGRGRHTTSSRQLIALPCGGVIIDTPGMRELQLWDADDGLERAFEDIAELARSCRFNDCGHVSEPGCAVLQAVDSGELPEGRLTSFRKLQREAAYLERRKDRALALAEKKRWKKLNQDARKRARHR